ncbi:hypothetical protein [Geothrix sp. 21YS21S-2]|uniref:hypothetical protein n=1 Tax=Geothrix sp. 21YS21S-2 TaxID=3068893 RepID=UPI0027BA6406|nr:hypothetical protein [Geothrix sp. 21YS21S-2]
MSNLIYVCRRESSDLAGGALLERVADWITPPPIKGFAHRIRQAPGEAVCLTGPGGAGGLEGTSGRVGAFVGDWPEWHRPGSAIPDGSFALVRSDGGLTELCSDYGGTRTLWYAITDTDFFVSTSQRAIICLLQGLSLSRPGFAWFLSSGSLGPSGAWDTRIRRLPRGARLTLDRARWTLSLVTTSIVFRNLPMRREEALEGLRHVLAKAIGSCQGLSPQWILPLSGGYDSRMLLATLYGTGLRPRTVTWGLAASRTQRGNDAFIAEKLARHYGLRNDYLLTEHSVAPPPVVVDAFIEAHGGTTDALFPYLDGLSLWARFALEGVDGIIRGDEGFGTISRPERHHRYAQDMILLSELIGDEAAEAVADGRQTLPRELRREPEETVQTYGDRLIHACFIPIHLAGLTDVKTPFVDVLNPMLAGSVLEFVRMMPDHLREGRNVYGQLTRSIGPPIPFAVLAADDSRNGFLQSDPYNLWMAEELASETMARLLPPPFRAAIAQSLVSESRSKPTLSLGRVLLKHLIPSSLVAAVRAVGPPHVPTNRVIAFRIALASRIIRLLERDSEHLARFTPSGGMPERAGT